MPLSILPTQPRYWRCTPGVLVPDLTEEVSSISPTLPGRLGHEAKRVTTCCCNWSRSWPCRHWWSLTNSCKVRTRAARGAGDGPRRSCASVQRAGPGSRCAGGQRSGLAAAVQIRSQEIVQGGSQSVQFFVGHDAGLRDGLLLFYSFNDRWPALP